jgi:aspartyl-tRNA synthetase
MMRTHRAGTLRATHIGTAVTLTGWVARRRDHGGVVFVDLRDASGVVQVVFRSTEAVAAAHAVRAEFCLRVRGVVQQRPAGNENPELPTGTVEVLAEPAEVLSVSAELPFPVEGAEEITSPVDEVRRWTYRYLDLRRAGPARALRTRARVASIIRRVMEDNDFVEVETPYLTRSTPEGARDFLVPVRLQPGCWYALPQSPQLFKQLLMVAGMERYYQLARCFRDEDFRADRVPEFTQLDVEMSFLDEEDVFTLTEELFGGLWREILHVELAIPFPRLTWAEAMRRYGSDKPDLRCDLELVDLTGFFAATTVRVLRGGLDQRDGHVGAVVVPGGAAGSRAQFEAWNTWAQGRGAKGIVYVAVDGAGADGLRSPLAGALSEPERAGFAQAAGAAPGDLVLLAAGPRQPTLELLGALRLAVAREHRLSREGEWRFLWVVDYPMFEPTDVGGWTAVHHPFTAPAPEWADRFAAEPGAALARAYDVVGNGVELGGGSIRIHQVEMQQRVFDVIGLSREEAAAKFGFLLEAFRFGPPPHGGIAFGLDRLVAVLVGTEAIREVMAFPKASSGGDPLTGAPTPITAEQRREAGIDAPPPPGTPPPPNEPGGETRPDDRRS